MEKETKRVLLYLTNQCNLNCRHCFLKASPCGTLHLSWEQIKKSLDYYRSQEYTEATFSGGEAIISPYLKQAIEYARSIGFTSINVNTNGVNPAILTTLSPELVSLLIFSVDGYTSDTHNYLRGNKAFERTMATLKKAIETGYKVAAIVTINRQNYSEIEDIVHMLDDLKVSRISFNFLSPRGNAKENLNLLITPQEWRQAYQRINAITGLKHVSLRIPPLFVTREEAEKLVKNDGYMCMLRHPAKKVEVLPDGRIYNCCILSDQPELASGKVTDEKITIDNTNETEFLKSHPIAYCPVQQYELPDTPGLNESDLVPICLYYKTIKEPDLK